MNISLKYFTHSGFNANLFGDEDAKFVHGEEKSLAFENQSLLLVPTALNIISANTKPKELSKVTFT